MVVKTPDGFRLLQNSRGFRTVRVKVPDKFLTHANVPSLYNTAQTNAGNWVVYMESRLNDGISYWYLFGRLFNSESAAVEFYWPHAWEFSGNPDFAVGEWFNSVPRWKVFAKLDLVGFADYLFTH